MEPEEKKPNGALIGSIIIIIILIAGGVYIWQTKIKGTLEYQRQFEDVVTPVEDKELNTLEQDLGNLNTELDVDTDTIE